jgi:integrase
VALIRRGKIWHVRFRFKGTLHKFSTKTEDKQLAQKIEKQTREKLTKVHYGLDDDTSTENRTQLLKDALADYLQEYRLDPEREGRWRFLPGRINQLNAFFAGKTVGQISFKAVRTYQMHRQEQGAATETVNMEVGVLCRGMRERGDQLRAVLKREKKLRLKGKPTLVGKPYSVAEIDRLTRLVLESKSPHLQFGLLIALNSGMRHAEICGLSWAQIDFAKKELVVGESKTEAGSGRPIPLNGVLEPAFEKHVQWFVDSFGEIKPEWYLFPGGHISHMDPAKHIGSFQTAWTTLRKRAGLLDRRFHDTRHTIVSELVENGENPEIIRQIVGHVSPAMMRLYSHPRREAKRAVLDRVTASREAQRTAASNVIPISAKTPAAKSRVASR